MTRSGAAASSLPQCKYFHQMKFLHEKTANQPTESNITPTFNNDLVFTLIVQLTPIQLQLERRAWGHSHVKSSVFWQNVTQHFRFCSFLYH